MGGKSAFLPGEAWQERLREQTSGAERLSSTCQESAEGIVPDRMSGRGRPERKARKIDTQGADFVILEACLPLLHPNSTVVVEYSPYHLYRSATGKADVERIAWRFSSLEIITQMGNPKRTAPLTVEQMLLAYDIYCREWLGHSDLVFKQLHA